MLSTLRIVKYTQQNGFIPFKLSFSVLDSTRGMMIIAQ